MEALQTGSAMASAGGVNVILISCCRTSGEPRFWGGPAPAQQTPPLGAVKASVGLRYKWLRPESVVTPFSFTI
jgi:hypothetical protein